MSENASVSSAIKAHLPLFGQFDLKVKIDEKLSNCSTLVFTVKFKVINPVIEKAFVAANSALNLPSFHTHVEVMAYDDCGVIRFITLEFPTSNKTQTQTVAINMPTNRCNPEGGDWKRMFFVAVDPFNRLSESREGNNFAKTIQSCIG